MGYFPAKSTVFKPTYKVRDTNGRRILAKSVSDGWSPETLHGVVSMMATTLLSFKGHFCPSCTPNRKTFLFGRKNRMVQPDSLNVGRKGFLCLNSPWPCAYRAVCTPPPHPTLRRRDSGRRDTADNRNSAAQAAPAPP